MLTRDAFCSEDTGRLDCVVWVTVKGEQAFHGAGGRARSVPLSVLQDLQTSPWGALQQLPIAKATACRIYKR